MAAVVDYPTPDILLDRTYDGDTGKRRSQTLTQNTSGVYPGWDRFGRVQRQAWFDGAMTPNGTPKPAIPTIVEELYTYDRASNRTGRYDERPGAVTANSDSRFAYDGLHRLTTEERGRDAGGYGAGGGWGYTLNSKQWTLDLLGNWTRVAFDANGDGDFNDSGVDQAEDRTHNNANEITVRELADELPTPAGPAIDSAYDHAGNTRTILNSSSVGVRYTHDAWNRLVEVETVAAGPAIATVARYEYNGLHWRTLRDDGIDERDLFYYSSDWQLLEEHRYEYESLPGTLERVAQQFWGLRYIDDAVARSFLSLHIPIPMPIAIDSLLRPGTAAGGAVHSTASSGAWAVPGWLMLNTCPATASWRPRRIRASV